MRWQMARPSPVPTPTAFRSTFVQRLRGVDDQIEEHLTQASLVCIDARHGAVELDEARSVANLIPRHSQR